MAAHVSNRKSKVKVLYCLVLYLFVMPPCLGLSVQKYLNRLNKPPLKSIKSLDGDIIDCVRISDQPAFDHPQFKNHKIQMRPSYYPEGVFDEGAVLNNGSYTISQLWHLSGRCPEGTIPIRRTKKEDVFRSISMEAFGKKNNHSIVNPKPNTGIITQGHEHAVAYVKGDKYHGAKAILNVWEPKVQQSNEFSLSQIWVIAGSFSSDLNSIEAGWQVSPGFYGDNKARLFIYWTTDAYQHTGCYNLLCSGFIQINHEIAIGGSISPISGYDAPQYEISLAIFKDQEPGQGNWWLTYGNGTLLGYWPAHIFSHLSDTASAIEWGGEVVNREANGQHTTTQMGSGHFPEEGFGKASYQRNIQIVDGSFTFRAPKVFRTFTKKPNCYMAQLGNTGGRWGNYLYYGGPGRNPNCP